MSGDLSMGSSVDIGGSGVDSSLYTPCDAIEPMVVELRASFAQGDATRSLEARRANIEGVLRIATEHAEEHHHRLERRPQLRVAHENDRLPAERALEHTCVAHGKNAVLATHVARVVPPDGVLRS